MGMDSANLDNLRMCLNLPEARLRIGYQNSRARWCIDNRRHQTGYWLDGSQEPNCSYVLSLLLLSRYLQMWSMRFGICARESSAAQGLAL